MNDLPPSGGRWIRHPLTGELVPVNDEQDDTVANDEQAVTVTTKIVTDGVDPDPNSAAAIAETTNPTPVAPVEPARKGRV